MKRRAASLQKRHGPCLRELAPVGSDQRHLRRVRHVANLPRHVSVARGNQDKATLLWRRVPLAQGPHAQGRPGAIRERFRDALELGKVRQGFERGECGAFGRHERPRRVVGVEVVYMAPEVLPLRDARAAHLSLEPLVVEVPAPEAHVGRGFDDRPGGDVQMSVDVLAVPAAVLAAHKHARAVGAVAHEDAPRRRSHHDLASHAVVDHERVTLVQDVNLAVLAPVDDKLLTVNGTRGLQELLAGALHVDEVLRVELGLRDEGLGLGFRFGAGLASRGGGITTILGLATHRVPRPFVFFRKKATHGSTTYSSVRRALGAPDRPDYKQRQILSSPFAPVWQTPVGFSVFQTVGLRCANG